MWPIANVPDYFFNFLTGIAFSPTFSVRSHFHFLQLEFCKLFNRKESIYNTDFSPSLTLGIWQMTKHLISFFYFALDLSVLLQYKRHHLKILHFAVLHRQEKLQGAMYGRGGGKVPHLWTDICSGLSHHCLLLTAISVIRIPSTAQITVCAIVLSPIIIQ